LEESKRLVVLIICFFVATFSWFSISSSVMANDLDTEKSPPDDSTFEHLAVEPTSYTYTMIDSNTEKLEIVIMGEGCTNWRDLDQTGTEWQGPCNYNWYDQDISSPFQFPHDPNEVTIMSLTVELRTYDIDAPYAPPYQTAEVDIVYLNNVTLGTLNGTNDLWSLNTFTPSFEMIVQGENRIDIDVDSTHVSRYWAMSVDWIKVTITCKLPSPPPSPTAVGGVWIPIDKLELLAPWISIASLITLATMCIACVKYRKKQQN